MRKIFTTLAAAFLAANTFAELAYNTVLTQSDLTNSSTVTKTEGIVEWENGAVRCGGSDKGAFSSDAWNWDDKYFVFKLANGVPDKLSFQYMGYAATTGTDYNVKESADGTNWTDLWSANSNANSYTSVTEDLKPTTRYIRICFSGNFSASFRNIKVTEKILMGTPSVESLDFGTVKVDDVVDAQSFTLGWTNLEAMAVSSDAHFTVSPATFGEIGAYNQTATIAVSLVTSAAGEYSSTITVEGRGKSAQVAVNGKVEKHDQTITWNPAESYNYGEAIPVAAPTSGLAAEYEISDASVLVFENGAFRALHGGEVTVTAKQNGNYKYNAAASVVKTITIVPPTTYGEFAETTCGQSVEFNGTTYTESFHGDVQMGQNYLGGDSLVHVAIAINQPSASEETKTIVFGAAETWNGIALSDSTVGEHEVVYVTTNTAGCDSVVTLHLTVAKQDVVVKPVELSFCEGSDAEFRGNYYSESGTYEVTATGAERDTLFQIHVTKLQPSFTTEEMTIQYGDPEVWNDQNLSAYTVGDHELSYETVNAAGCDSIVTLYLTVVKKDTFEAEQELTFCDGDSAEYRGVWYKEAGEYTIEVEGETQDTLITVNVIVYAVDKAVDRMTVAAGDKITLPEGEWLIDEKTFAGEYLTSEADVPELVFVQSGKTEEGCDAITELVVTVTSREGVENVSVEAKAEKFMRDGKLFIRRGEAIYTATGERVE